MAVIDEFLQVLRHDLHKVRVAGALAHKTALPSELAKRADGIAAWLGRKFLREPFETAYYRKSLVFRTLNLYNPRALVAQHRLELADLFADSDSIKLHRAILDSKLLNLFSEAREYPYTSLKYHILLVCALFYNFCKGVGLKDLYLCENLPVESPFQIIYRDSVREWALLTQKQNALSKFSPTFFISWERRQKLSIGGDSQVLDALLSRIGSWTVALAFLEDFQALVSLA
jgi:hypothetical protein